MRKWRPRCNMTVMRMCCLHSLLWIGRFQLLPFCGQSPPSLHHFMWAALSQWYFKYGGIFNELSGEMNSFSWLISAWGLPPLWPGWNFLWTVLKSEIFPDTINLPSVSYFTRVRSAFYSEDFSYLSYFPKKSFVGLILFYLFLGNPN